MHVLQNAEISCESELDGIGKLGLALCQLVLKDLPLVDDLGDVTLSYVQYGNASDSESITNPEFKPTLHVIKDPIPFDAMECTCMVKCKKGDRMISGITEPMNLKFADPVVLTESLMNAD